MIHASQPPISQVAMLIDTEKCTGCRACVVSCKRWNGLPQEINRFHHTEEGRARFSAIRWIDVVASRYPVAGEAGKEKWIFTRQSCMHCREAACVKVCPVGAIDHLDNGLVEINQKRCIGCNYCAANCTFNVIGFDQARNVARKCTFCTDRLAQGLAPACASTCPTGTLTFGSRQDMLSLAFVRKEELGRKGYTEADIYGLDELGGLGMVYLLHAGKEDSMQKYGLPEDPQVPAAALLWSYLYKPLRFFLSGALIFALWINKSETMSRGGKES